MLTKYALSLACSILISASIFGIVQIKPAVAGYMATHGMREIALKSTQTPEAVETVIINISGTTNSCPQVMFIRSNGAITYLACIVRKYVSIPLKLANTLFTDLHTAFPLNSLPKNRGCLKSTSFGSTTYLVLNTHESPDISCSVDALGEELYTDVKAIQVVLHTMILPPQRPSDGFNRRSTR